MNEKIIKRKKYINRINRFRDKPIIKVITGQRRVGKSFILKSIMADLRKKGVLNENIIYLNKEDLQYDYIVSYKELHKHIEEKRKKANKSRKVYLFIDEIQEIEKFEKAVRSYALDKKFDIYITGSNSKIISSELSSFLSGRFIEINIFPLDYNEFLKFSNLKNSQSNLEKFIKYGGMPFIHNTELKDELVYTYAKNVFNTILLKDVVKKFEIRNIQFLEKLTAFLCNNIGYIFSANSISKYLLNDNVKITPGVILDYLHALSSSYFIHEIKRFDLKGKKVFKSNSKFYINDIGIRNAIVGYDESFVNQLIENIVCLHLLSNEYKVYVGLIGDKEIDFVAVKNKQIKYIQVALTVQDKKTREREFGNLLKIDDNYEKIVVSMDPISSDYKGIKHYKLGDFLEKI